MADRKKMLEAGAIAAVIIVPIAAAAWYFWPKDIYLYIYAQQDPVSYAVALNGEIAVEGAWNGTDRNLSSSPLVHFAKKTVPGPGLELGVSADGGAPVKGRYSIFDGAHFTIYLFDDVLIVQSKAEPPGARPFPG